MKRPYIILAATIGLSACGGNSSTPETVITQSENVAGTQDTLSDATATDSTTAATSVTPDITLATEDSTPVATDDTVANVSPAEPTNLNSPFISLGTDPIWRVCPADVGIDNSDSWQVLQTSEINVGEDGFRVCVKPCPAGDSFIPDPNFPGLGWDNTLSTACAVVSDTGIEDPVTGGTEFHTVPLYLPDQQPSRQTFSDVGAFEIFTGGGVWQCARQQRTLSSDTFTNTGVEITYQFSSDGSAVVQRNGTGEQLSSLWFFDRRAGSKVIVLKTGLPSDESIIPAEYAGNVQIDGNRMFIYRTTVDRLACTSERPANTVPELPVTIAQAAELPALLLNDVLDRPMNCTAYELQKRCIDCETFITQGLTPGLESSPQPEFINISQSAVVDQDGSVRYQFQSDSNETFTANEDGMFDSFFNIGISARSFDSNQVYFRQLGDRVVMTESETNRSSNNIKQTDTLSICDVQNDSQSNNLGSVDNWPDIGDVSGKSVVCQSYVYEPYAAEIGIGSIADGWVQAANGFSDRSWSFATDGTGLINGYGLGFDRSFTWSQSPNGLVTMTNSFGDFFLQNDTVTAESWNATPDDWEASRGHIGTTCRLHTP